MKLIHERISGYAASFPEKTAVTDPRGDITYGEMEERSSSISRTLAELGVGTGDAVAVYVPYVKEILLGAVSAFRTGAVFVPFDSGYPEDRLAYMLEDSGTKAILTLKELWEEKPLKFPAEKVIFMDETEGQRGQAEQCGPDGQRGQAEQCGPAEQNSLDKQPGEDQRESSSPCADLNEDSPAMLLYTSGTTGNPKGVLHIHRMLLHIVDWTCVHEDAAIREDTRSGIISSFSFVGTQMFLLGPLSRGGTVCIAPEVARKDIASLYRFLREQNVTHIFIPSGLAAIIAEDYDISGIFIFAAGEKLRNFRPLVPGCFLIDSYGSTETSGVLSKKVYGDESRILVGKPYVNTKAMIVDEAIKPVKTGEAGELLISNAFMSRQYYKLPELSAEKWIQLDGETWFRTGDRAVKTDEGDYDILGRIDNMVKLRGFRIETGEVESQVLKAAEKLGRDDVRQAVVVVKTVGGIDNLVCYYEALNDLDREAVTEEISKNLTEYMIPKVWVRMEELPRNANGKVVRAKLPDPKQNRENAHYGALDSEVLARLVYTLEDVLNTTVSISPDDSFTDLGGTSLTAMQYTALLREQGIRISSAQVLQLNVLRRIADAAEVVYEQLWTKEEYAAVRKDFESRGEKILKVLPISPEQDEMLFKQIFYPDRFHFRSAVFLQVDSPVSEEDLREALDTVSEENEALRSAIVFHDVEVIQQVITDRKIPLKIVDTETLGSREMSELKSEFLYTQVDLQRSCLIRAIFIRAAGRYMLCILTSDIAFDKARRNVFLARLMDLLAEKYPEDESISGWRELLRESLAEEESTAPEKAGAGSPETGISGKVPPEMCVYSENAGPKLVFVHTANTGSAAYYRLAARIGGGISFSVIEPFNLYHAKEARYGIRNIAAKYIEILKRHQPEGPYFLGGWCYGGMVAHEMACQLEAMGEEVRYLFMLDSHAPTSDELRESFKSMSRQVSRKYFETSPLFADLREAGMLEDVVRNAEHSSEDMMNHVPSVFHGNVLYFKPDQLPSGIPEESRRYWQEMMGFEAGNYEHYCSPDKLRVVHTPHEHDLMMDDPSLDIIVPELMEAIGVSIKE